MSHTFAKTIAGIISMWFVLNFMPVMASLNRVSNALDQNVPDNVLATLLSTIGILIVGIYGVLAVYFISGALEDIVSKPIKLYLERRKSNGIRN